MTTAKMLFLLGYDLKIVVQCEGGGEGIGREIDFQ